MQETIIKYNGKNKISIFQKNNLILEQVFKDIEEGIIHCLAFLIKQNNFLIHFSRFPTYINKKLDTLYGNSFNHKFNHATISKSDFVGFMIKEHLTTDQNNKKLTFLLSPVDKISHDSSVTIKLKPEYKITQHMKTNCMAFKTNNFVKPNISFFTDASVMDKTFLAGYGVCDTELVISFRKEEVYQDNNLAELKAIKQAILIAKDMNLSTVEIFTDSAPSIEFIKKYLSYGKVNEYFNDIVKDISNELSFFESYQIAWIPRNKNQFADKMSKAGFPQLS